MGLRASQVDGEAAGSPMLDVGDRGAAFLVAALAREFTLSRREAEIVAAAAAGMSTKEAAAHLRISDKTVQYFWKRVFTKLACHSQLEVMALLLRRALRAGAASPSDDPGIA